jgi:hypothetical protein
MYRELMENGTYKKDYWYEFFKNPVGGNPVTVRVRPSVS